MNAAQRWLYEYITAWSNHLDITPLAFWEQGFDDLDIRDTLYAEGVEGMAFDENGNDNEDWHKQSYEMLVDAWDDMPNILEKAAKEAAKEAANA